MTGPSTTLPLDTRLELLTALYDLRLEDRSLVGLLSDRFDLEYTDVREFLGDLVDRGGRIVSLRALTEEISHLQAEVGDIAGQAVQAVQARLAGAQPPAQPAARRSEPAPVPRPMPPRPAAPSAQRPTPSPADVAGRVSDPEPRRELRRVLLTNLHLDPDNVREVPDVDDPDIVELAESIREVGLLQPITARRTETGQLVIVMGHRRYVACKRLGLSTVDVVVRQSMRTSDVLAAMLVENGQRRDLNPIEEARGLRRLALDLGHNGEAAPDITVAKKVGRSGVYVGGRLALLSLSPDEQAAIAAGEMTLTEGTAKARINSGRVGKTGVDRNWHLGPNHPLAQHAKARCRRLSHSRARTVGGMACGECWESVIRADTRQDFVDVAHKTGECPVCSHPVERHTHTHEGATA